MPGKLLQHDHILPFVSAGSHRHSPDIGDSGCSGIAMSPTGLSALIDAQRNFMRRQRLQSRSQGVEVRESVRLIN